MTTSSYKFFQYAFVSFLVFLGLGCWAASQFSILKSKHLLGEESWDYLSLDSQSRRLYVPRFNHIIVLDTDSLNQVGEIQGTSGVHGIALALKMGRGYTSNGRAGTVSVVSLNTLKVLNDLRVGEGPDAILFDEKTEKVFVFNGHSKSISVIDSNKSAVVSTIDLPGRPEFAVSDGKGMLFLNLEDKNSIASIDTVNLKIKAIYPIAPCESPSGLAMDKKNRRLFSVCENRIMVITNADSGKIITTLPIGAGADAASFDEEKSLAFSSNGRDGTLTIVKQESSDKYSVVQNLATAKGARTHVLDERTHRLFLIAGNYGPKPEPTTENPHPRSPIIDGSVECLVVGSK